MICFRGGALQSKSFNNILKISQPQLSENVYSMMEGKN